MSDNNIEVKFGAQTSGLKEGTQQAAAALEQAVARMERAFASMSRNVAGSTSSVNSSLNTIKEQSARTADAIEGSAGMLTRFASVAAVIAAGKAFTDLADKVQLTDARLKLVTKTAEGYAEAQKEIYRISQQNNVGIAETTQLYTKMAGPVERLGGGARETAAIVDSFATSMRLGGASTQEAAAATLQFAQAMGSGKLQGDEFRSLAEASPRFMQALAEGMGVPIERLKTMGSEGKLTADIVGNALIKSLDQLKGEAESLPDTAGGAFTRLKNDAWGLADAMNKAGDVTNSLAHVFDTVAMFVRELSEVFKDTTVSSTEANNSFEVGTFLIKVFGTVVETVVVVLANLKFTFTTIVGTLVAVGMAIDALAHGRLKEIPKIFDDAAENAKKAAEELDAFEKRTLKMTDNVLAARERLKNGGKSEGEVETKTGYTKLKPSTPPEDKNIMQKWELELDRQKLAHEKMNAANGTFYQFSKQQELEFWQSKLKAASLTEEQKLQLQKKIVDKQLEIGKTEFEAVVAGYKVQLETYKFNMDKKLEIANEFAAMMKQKFGEESKEYKLAAAQILQIEREKRQQMRQLEDEYTANAKAYAMADVDARQRAAQLEVDLGLKTQAEMLAAERRFEDERFEIARQALADRINLMANDPTHNPVELAKLLTQIQELGRDHNAKMTEIDAKGTMERTKYSRMFFDGMEQGMTGVLSSFLKGTMKIRDLFRNLAASILDAFTNMLAKYLVQQVMTSTGIMSAKTTEASTVVAANAGEAASGAAASQASIPYVGPAMAAAAFAATMAMVLGAKKLFSASKGFDVPAGVNPVTQLHESEMVLPKEQADVIRGMAGGGGGNNQPINIHISAVDSRSVRDLFMREGTALADSIKRQARNFKVTGQTLKGA